MDPRRAASSPKRWSRPRDRQPDRAAARPTCARRRRGRRGGGGGGAGGPGARRPAGCAACCARTGRCASARCWRPGCCATAPPWRWPRCATRASARRRSACWARRSTPDAAGPPVLAAVHPAHRHRRPAASAMAPPARARRRPISAGSAMSWLGRRAAPPAVPVAVSCAAEPAAPARRAAGPARGLRRSRGRGATPGRAARRRAAGGGRPDAGRVAPAAGRRAWRRGSGVSAGLRRAFRRGCRAGASALRVGAASARDHRPPPTAPARPGRSARHARSAGRARCAAPPPAAVRHRPRGDLGVAAPRSIAQNSVRRTSRRGERQAASTSTRQHSAGHAAPLRSASGRSKDSASITVAIARPAKPQARRIDRSARAGISCIPLRWSDRASHAPEAPPPAKGFVARRRSAAARAAAAAPAPPSQTSIADRARGPSALRDRGRHRGSSSVAVETIRRGAVEDDLVGRRAASPAARPGAGARPPASIGLIRPFTRQIADGRDEEVLRRHGRPAPGRRDARRHARAEHRHADDQAHAEQPAGGDQRQEAARHVGRHHPRARTTPPSRSAGGSRARCSSGCPAARRPAS